MFGGLIMATIQSTKYSHRFLARIIIEAKTPLAVGSGNKDIITDALVAKDVNGMPYIPATSIAGVLRSMMGKEADSFFGFQAANGGKGSEIIFTEAKILSSTSQVIDGLNIEAVNDALLEKYVELPIRQHVRIDSNGVAVDHGKFDEQIVFKGSRFCFEIEMVSDGTNYEQFQTTLLRLSDSSFRIGGGTRCGFGEIEIIELRTKCLDLTKETDLKLYLDKSSNLSVAWSGWDASTKPASHTDSNQWISYKLELSPEDCFLFSSGFGDEDTDMTPVKARQVNWENNRGQLSDMRILIPATSVKGALAHRVAYHWNRLNKYYIGDDRAKVGKDNEAVKALFGSEGEKEDNEMTNQVRGNLLFSDVIQALNSHQEKILNHVKIDRFTGGAIDGALFNEKTIYGKNESFEFTMLANKVALATKNAETNITVQQALEAALMDICKGLLPLGGGVNRGNGVFTGTLTRDNQIIYPQTTEQSV